MLLDFFKEEMLLDGYVDGVPRRKLGLPCSTSLSRDILPPHGFFFVRFFCQFLNANGKYEWWMVLLIIYII
jgi:hypothetical protein